MSHEANQNNAFENDDICEESCLKDSRSWWSPWSSGVWFEHIKSKISKIVQVSQVFYSIQVHRRHGQYIWHNNDPRNISKPLIDQ